MYVCQRCSCEALFELNRGLISLVNLTCLTHSCSVLEQHLIMGSLVEHCVIMIIIISMTHGRCQLRGDDVMFYASLTHHRT